MVEDNFVIGSDLKSDVAALGFSTVDLFPGEESAMAFLEKERPDVAVLDYSLGHGLTSERIALRLLDMGVPFLFVSGHGDRIELDGQLKFVPILTKPLVWTDLEAALAKIMT